MTGRSVSTNIDKLIPSAASLSLQHHPFPAVVDSSSSADEVARTMILQLSSTSSPPIELLTPPLKIKVETEFKDHHHQSQIADATVTPATVAAFPQSIIPNSNKKKPSVTALLSSTATALKAGMSPKSAAKSAIANSKSWTDKLGQVLINLAEGSSSEEDENEKDYKRRRLDDELADRQHKREMEQRRMKVEEERLEIERREMERKALETEMFRRIVLEKIDDVAIKSNDKKN